MSRNPEPTKLKELKGTAKNIVEPEYAEASTEAPTYLTGLAKELWDELAPGLHANGLLTIADIPLFAEFCKAYSNMREANDILDADGLLIAGRQGAMVKNPAWQIKREASETMMKIGSRFGMTPADRARLGTADSVDKNIEDLLSQFND